MRAQRPPPACRRCPPGRGPSGGGRSSDEPAGGRHIIAGALVAARDSPDEPLVARSTQRRHHREADWLSCRLRRTVVTDLGNILPACSSGCSGSGAMLRPGRALGRNIGSPGEALIALRASNPEGAVFVSRRQRPAAMWLRSMALYRPVLYIFPRKRKQLRGTRWRKAPTKQRLSPTCAPQVRATSGPFVVNWTARSASAVSSISLMAWSNARGVKQITRRLGA